MPPTGEDLTPTDGLSNRWIEFEGIDRRGRGHFDVKFRIYDREDGEDHWVSSITFPVAGSNELYEAVALAHDDLIAFLRQALYAADIMRNDYRNVAERHRQQRS